jgi:arsenate reductase
VPDPAAVQGDDLARAKAFFTTFMTLRRRIELLLSLPLASLDRLALQQRVRDIGTQ